jgi:hypothetical protein
MKLHLGQVGTTSGITIGEKAVIWPTIKSKLKVENLILEHQ